ALLKPPYISMPSALVRLNSQEISSPHQTHDFTADLVPERWPPWDQAQTEPVVDHGKSAAGQLRRTQNLSTHGLALFKPKGVPLSAPTRRTSRRLARCIVPQRRIADARGTLRLRLRVGRVHGCPLSEESSTRRTCVQGRGRSYELIALLHRSFQFS